MKSHHTKHSPGAQAHSPGATTTRPTTVAAGNGGPAARVVSTEDIRLCAYRKWESAGRPTGDGVQFWLDAEKELGPGN